MTYQSWTAKRSTAEPKTSNQTVADTQHHATLKPPRVAGVAGVAGVGTPVDLARDVPTAKLNLSFYINNDVGTGATPATLATHGSVATPSELVSFREGGGAAKPLPAVKSSDYRQALAAFKKAKPHGATRHRHDQACWAAEMFLNEWQGLAAEFGWSSSDIFAPPRANHSGLAYWLDTDIVTALGPDHAGTERNRVFNSTTRTDWINPCQNETRQ